MAGIKLRVSLLGILLLSSWNTLAELTSVIQSDGIRASAICRKWRRPVARVERGLFFPLILINEQALSFQTGEIKRKLFLLATRG